MTLLLAVACGFVVLGFSPGLMEQFETPKAAAVRLLGAAALGMVAGRGLRRRPARLDVAILIAFAVAGICTLTSTAPLLSLFGDPRQREGLLTAVGLLGLYFGARAFPVATRRGLDVFLIASALACTYALLQAARFDVLRWERTSGYGPGLVRPFGTLGNPNLLGVVSAATFALALARSWTQPARRWLYAPAVALFGATTVVTLSRGAWLAAFAGAGVLLVGGLASGARLVVRGRRAWIVTGAGVAVVVVALLAASGWRTLLLARGGELLSPTSGSAASRLEIWKSAASAWRARPWVGHGPDTFALVFPWYQTPDYWRLEWGGLANHAHSVVLQTLATQGLLGMIALAAGLAAFVVTARRAGSQSPSAALEVTAAAAAVLVAGLFGAFGIAGWTLLAVCAARVATLAEAALPAPAPKSRAAPIVGVLAGAAMLACTANELLASRAAAYTKRALTPAPEYAVAAATAAVRHAPWDDEMHRLLAEALLEQSSRGRAREQLLERAAASGRNAVLLSPRRVQAWQRLGTIEMARAAAGDSSARARAESAYARSLALSPQNTLALLELARGQLQLRRFDAAREAAQRAADRLPNDALAVATLGHIARASGDVAAARTAYTHAIRLDWHGREAERTTAQSALASLGEP